MLRISQPQMHNVLKGTRKLRPELADKIMEKFDISVPDLLSEQEISEHLAWRRAKIDHSRYLALLHARPAEKRPATGDYAERYHRKAG